MRRVSSKVGYIEIGRERFPAGSVLPEDMPESMVADLEKIGAIEPDKPKRSTKAETKVEDKDSE